VDSDFLFTDSAGALQSAKFNTVKSGYAVGGGVEAPLTNWLSVKAEYLYVDVDRMTAAQTSSTISPQPFAQSADLKANIVRVGLNYRFVGEDPRLGVAMPVKAPILKAPPLIASDWGNRDRGASVVEFRYPRRASAIAQHARHSRLPTHIQGSRRHLG
jgi:Outer membrane protein beta-barrel domain